MPPFAYFAPSTVPEAVALLVEHADEEPRVLAGGQSLVPLMNVRLAQPGRLVDLRRVAGLDGIRMDGDVLVLGAMVRQAVAERSPEVALAAQRLANALGHVAHLPVRNSGTVGGSLAHADRAAELPTVALALDAELVAHGPQWERRIPAADFFPGPAGWRPRPFGCPPPRRRCRGRGRRRDRRPAAGRGRARGQRDPRRHRAGRPAPGHRPRAGARAGPQVRS